MKTLNTLRKFKGEYVRVDYTRAGSYDTVLTARVTQNEGGDELMHLLGFQPTTTRGHWAYYRRTFNDSKGAKAFLIGQRQWRVV